MQQQGTMKNTKHDIQSIIGPLNLLTPPIILYGLFNALLLCYDFGNEVGTHSQGI